MNYIHVLMAVLASWRITELFTQDRITDKLRKKFPTYLWQCPRCMSVWAGLWATLVVLLGQRYPLVLWLNWPFALAWLYLMQVERVVQKRVAERGRELTIRVKDGQTAYNSELSPQDSLGVMQMVAQQLIRQTQPQPPPAQTNGEVKPI